MMTKILIVDDSQFQRNRIKRALKQEGYVLLEGKDGHEALEMSATHAPDCMLLDLLMPNMDGIEALMALRERSIEVPVIVLTADIQDSTRERCLELGVAAIISKPYNRDELRDTISKIVGDRSEATDERN